MELKEFLKAFGARLLQVRKAKKMTQSQLSDASGLTVGQISDFENGKVNITSDSLRKLCIGLQVKPVVLFDWE